MDSRPTFLPPPACEVVTDRDSGTPYWIGGQGKRAGRQANPPAEASPRARAKAKASSEARDSRSREKLLA